MTRAILFSASIALLIFTAAGITYQLDHKAKVAERGIEMKKRMGETGGLYCGGNVEFC